MWRLTAPADRLIALESLIVLVKLPLRQEPKTYRHGPSPPLASPVPALGVLCPGLPGLTSPPSCNGRGLAACRAHAGGGHPQPLRAVALRPAAFLDVGPEGNLLEHSVYECVLTDEVR